MDPKDLPKSEPAFPVEFKYGDGTAERAWGMSLRDYFAAKAMAVLIDRSFELSNKSRDELRQNEGSIAAAVAADAYGFADAMLKAREQ